MKIIFIIFTAIVVLVGCDATYNSQLVQAERTIETSPDSAFAILEQIDFSELRNNRNKALYALLYTQAQYKCYETIKDDSLIDIAVKYYTDHLDQDKLTRSLMYKGAALADMKLYKSAIDWYKKAELSANSSDYLTLGLLNTRMGELYQYTFVANNEHIAKYKKALHCYELIDHQKFINLTLGNIGQLYRLQNRDSAYYYINKSLALAQNRRDINILLYNQTLLAELYNLDHRYADAKNEALHIIRNGDSINIGNAPYSSASLAYAKLNMIDSATYYAERLKMSNSSDTMDYFILLEEIAIAQNDYQTAYKYDNLSTAIANNILKHTQLTDIYLVEKRFDNQVANVKAENYKSQVSARNYLIVSIIILLAILIIISYVLWKRKKRILNEQSRFIDQIQTEFEFQHNALDFNLHKIAELNQTLNQKEAIENKLRAIIDERVSLMREIMLVKYQFVSKPEKFVDKFNKITLLNREYKEASKSIIEIANTLNNDIIDKLIRENYNLSERDLVLFSLLCLKFSSAEISVFMGYSSYNSANVSRCVLLKKLGITSTLDDFIALKTAKSSMLT